ncbi:DMT family transporter [Crocinitomicaceae bacterium CZZ-1]|uniref:DMT family transporter n=1 Tax=Taishania pollutisoli TaxID=2766479 RepID=A0A8J6PF21_9FLAO|nr:DMT family transporter [Taishania pollutisoli]MBC9813085.1 DMT family transporter [Taishania pollutisoli]
MRARGYMLAAVSAVFYGLIPLFILPVKAIGFPLDVTLFYRFFIAALILLAYLIYKKESLRMTGKEALIYVALGLFYSLSSECLFLGYDYLTPGIASTILFVYPVIVALIMVFFFREKITKPTIFSLIISLLGVGILSMKDAGFQINVTGFLIALGSALFYALYLVIVNKSELEVSGMKITFYSLLFSSAYYFIKSFVLQKSLALPSVEVLVDISLFSLITTVFSIMALIYAIQLIGSTHTAIMGALEPVIAIVISVGFFGEHLTVTLTIGVAMILIGVLINVVSGEKMGEDRL